MRITPVCLPAEREPRAGASLPVRQFPSFSSLFVRLCWLLHFLFRACTFHSRRITSLKFPQQTVRSPAISATLYPTHSALSACARRPRKVSRRAPLTARVSVFAFTTCGASAPACPRAGLAPSAPPRWEPRHRSCEKTAPLRVLSRPIEISFCTRRHFPPHSCCLFGHHSPSTFPTSAKSPSSSRCLLSNSSAPAWIPRSSSAPDLFRLAQWSPARVRFLE